MPKKLKGIIRLRSELTLEDLKRIESTEERRADTPSALRRSEIIIADKPFQWRPDAERSEEHVRGLVNAIAAQRPLPPLLVTAIGQEFYLLDGHHRLEAYHTAGWKKKIPVEVFPGTLMEAWDEAFARNRDDKLPMSAEAKLQAAWVRFNAGGISWSALEQRFGVSNGTIQRMSKIRKALLAAKQDPTEVLWRDARSPENTTGEDFDYATHVSAAASKMADQLRNISNFTKDAEITARAISLVSPAMIPALADFWRHEGEGAFEDDEAPETHEPDFATALSLIVGQLQAGGHGELAQQLREALQEAFERHMAQYKL